MEDCFTAPPWLPPERPEADKKGALPLHPFRFRPCWEAEEVEAVWASFCYRGTTGEVPPWSAEEADDEAALTGPAKNFLAIFGGCRVFWTSE